VSSTLDADTAELVRAALAEDIGSGDVTTTATVSEQASARALITQKAPGVIYGLRAAELAFAALDPDARFERLVQEGEWREEGGPVLSVQARARALLSAERTALNFLAHLSGVATLAARARACTRRARCRAHARACSTRARPLPACAGWRRRRWRRAARAITVRVCSTRS
jgi:nicotinate-nucleotide pyrophosphorylase (carboxylating)